MRYCEISKEMSSLYFGLAVFCLFEARILEFDTQPLPLNSCGLYNVHCTLNIATNSVTLVLTAKYIKPKKIQRRHLFADLTISHLWIYGYLHTAKRYTKKPRQQSWALEAMKR